ncbi:ABC transporter permease [Longispora fulva]|uniref:Multiple sugar transport system permease protein n=1 Tax=Longispora fulva TaxID=619741 RepID=A0A8J7GFW3_9ACTN|nr:sugar ABC transporter permease [Longispora fulva]MBG6136990.1 multiple sugar transport system permease protein [Longispora fulva]GIG61657.1 ABC transporter permease [Longispora fulva]
MVVPPTRAPGPVAVPRAARSRRRGRWIGWLFVAPFLLVFAVTVLAPIGYAGYLSAYQDLMVGGERFVGLDNLLGAVRDARLHEAVGRVCLILAVQVPVMTGLAAVFALAIDSGRLGAARLFRIGLFLPYAVPGVIATLLWGFLYGDQFGLVHSVNDTFGWHVPNPLSGTWALPAIGNIVTWEYVGYNMLIFYSALRVIPAELYEAAALDGAGPWRVAWSIKLPALRPALVIATLFSIIGSFQLFNEPAILKSLAPNVISTYYTPNMYAYNLSFAGQEYNYSAAIALVVGVATAVCAWTFQAVAARRKDA